MNYRTDIDGLRCIAILPVVFFHMGISSFEGGFIGVDIFFVISGFLISSVIIEKVEQGNFSFKSFYLSRVRRLAPAAFFMFLTVSIIFAFIFPPHLYEDAIKGVIFSLFFVSNLFFWKEGDGYFGKSLENNPLLHTWSLSVEEQFYIFFPFLIIIMLGYFKSRKLFTTSVFTIFLISLCLSTFFVSNSTSYASFFLLPTRAYELLLGVIAFLFTRRYHLNPSFENSVIRPLGISLIIYSLFFFNKEMPFPSYNALIPCLGALLLLISKSKTGLIYSVFSFYPVRYIGLISYSLYLFHWPIIVFYSYKYPSLTNFDVIIQLFVMLIFASFSTSFIEKTYRDSIKFPAYRLSKHFFISALFLLPSMFFLLFSGNSYIVDPSRNLERTYAESQTLSNYELNCFNAYRRNIDFSKCVVGTGTPDSKKILIWGDSHGNAFMPALDSLSKIHEISYINHSGCPPLVNLERTEKESDCIEINNKVIQHILKNNPDLVILVGAFNNYINWNIIKYISPNQVVNETSSAFMLSLRDTDSFFRNNKISYIILEQNPRFDEDVPYAFSRNMINSGESNILIEKKSYKEQSLTFKQAASKLSLENIWSFESYLCDSKSCHSSFEGHLLYKDAHHISIYGAKHLSKITTDLIQDELTFPPNLRP